MILIDNIIKCKFIFCIHRYPFQYHFSLEHRKMLSSILQPLREDLDSEARKNCVNICRTNILDGALRAFKRNSFNPRAQMDVKFVTGNANLELGMDNGGPKREFFRLVVSELRGLHIFSRPRAQICFCATSEYLAFCTVSFYLYSEL